MILYLALVLCNQSVHPNVLAKLEGGTKTMEWHGNNLRFY